MVAHSELIDVGSAELYCESRGSGPAIVLVPGGAVDGGFYDDLAGRLADEFTVVTYDRRGTSRSPEPAGRETTIVEQAEDLATLIEIKRTGPAVVWASSIGGVIALELFRRHPGLVRGLLVHEPPLFSVLDDGPEMARRQLEEIAAEVNRGGPGAALELHARRELGEIFDRLRPELRQRMHDNAQWFFTVELPGLSESMPSQPELERCLRSATVPVQAVAGLETRGAPLHTAAQWVAEHSGRPLRELPGAHLPYVVEPDATATFIRSFCNEISERGSTDDLGFTDNEEFLGFTRPPARASRGQDGRSRVSGYLRVKADTFYEREISRVEEAGISLWAYGMNEEFFGGITGVGVASHVRVVRDDGIATFTGVERVTGALDGRTGSFAITDAGYYDRHGIVHGRWTVVAGSGTGELTALRAEGDFTVAMDAPGGPLSTYNLTYWFD